MTTVRIFEPAFGGHHLVYVRLIAEAMRAAGYTVVVVTSARALESREFDENIGGLGSIVLESIVEGVPPRRALENLLASSASGDSVLIVPNADPHLGSLMRSRARRGSGPCVVALVMRFDGPPFREDWRAALKSGIKRALVSVLSRARGITVLRLGPASAKGLAGVVPDPVLVEQRGEIGWMKAELDPARRWFGLVGVINDWKNPMLVVESMRRVAESCRAGILIVGPVAPHLRDELRHAERDSKGSVVVLDRTLTNAEFNSVVAEVWATVCAYSTHAPNSTVAKSVALGTKVVAAGSAAYLANVKRVAPHAYLSALSEEALGESLIRAAMDGPDSLENRDMATGAAFAKPFVEAVGELLNAKAVKSRR